ncbi:hypothetical protein ACLMJK_003526 [Lecanora helva]
MVTVGQQRMYSWRRGWRILVFYGLIGFKYGEGEEAEEGGGGRGGGGGGGGDVGREQNAIAHEEPFLKDEGKEGS